MPSDSEKNLSLYNRWQLLERGRNKLRPFARAVLGRRFAYPVAPDDPQGLCVDALLAIDEESFYIKGWMKDKKASITHLTAISPEGNRTELIEKMVCYPRPDVEQFYGIAAPSQHMKAGFSCYFEVQMPSARTGAWKIQMRNAAKMTRKALAPSVVQDPITARNMILQDLVAEQLPEEENLLRNHIFPAINRLQEQLNQTVEVASITHYGMDGAAANVSIIVPLYQRIDFLEQQLAQFVHDPEIGQADLIYILDSPELANSLREAATQLFRLYRVPFRVVVLNRNAGFSAVNNVGASLAYGRLLLLLNSDVLPDKPGWLGQMMAFYDATPGIGALGPKLLYEDDSLQHAGLYFSRPVGASLWENMHYFKGLHRHLPAANVARPVPAVTAACLMISKDLYQHLGGLRGIYVQGDYEDSDLCLRLIEAGYQNWYLPRVELYHLEGQSYPEELRRLTRRYNTWLHTHNWNERIAAVMAAYRCQPRNSVTQADCQGDL